MARVDVEDLQDRVDQLQRPFEELQARLDKAVQRIRGVEIKAIGGEE